MIAGVMSLMHIVVFLVIGAWPVVFFFGLDFHPALRCLLAQLPHCAGREEGSVSRTDVSVRKFAPSGG
ncbi:DUF2244 domain-containing protein [Sinorhizobium meliloti]|nr:DUF2244 domain-containing protein [Sinorhizobium meliloti]